MIYTRYGGGWGCLLIGALALVLLFYFLRAILYVLYIVSPVLILAAIVLNWRAVWDTLREFWALLLERPLSGLIMAVLAVVLYPVTALYMFLRALGYRQMEQIFGPTASSHSPYASEGEYIEYEEIETRSPSSEPRIEEVDIEPIPPPDDLPKDQQQS